MAGIVEEVLVDAVCKMAKVQVGADPDVVVEVDEHRQEAVELREGYVALLEYPCVLEETSVALILGCIVLVDELSSRIEPTPQLNGMVAVNLGCPNPPAFNDIVELRAEPLLLVLLTFSGTAVDMGSQTFQVLSDLLAEHDELWTAFDRVREPIVEIYGVDVFSGTEAIR